MTPEFVGYECEIAEAVNGGSERAQAACLICLAAPLTLNRPTAEY